MQFYVGGAVSIVTVALQLVCYLTLQSHFWERTFYFQSINFVNHFICAEIFKGSPPNQHDKIPVSLVMAPYRFLYFTSSSEKCFASVFRIIQDWLAGK
jgi:hypothetical protein